ncbi:MAG: hypothetical protein U1A07_26475, partial [Phenylobacterium sp.]|nr:hypothetical protein [Phenylobacterium sp.]
MQLELSVSGEEPAAWSSLIAEQIGLARTKVLVMADAKDIRMMTIYGYSRLVGFNEKLEIVPDILESFEVEEGR